MPDLVKIAWWGKHFGEEPPLIGSSEQGAGGIFFTGCYLRCVFCQNYQISQENFGKEYSVVELAQIMLDLQGQGAINIDLVTPTIWWKQIKESILLARSKGLTLPIVWNSNGYESLEILKEMVGLIDIYLPDFKYSNDELGFKYSGIKNYSSVADKAIREMYHQVGLFQEEKGIGKRGLIVRHMVLPGALENSCGVLEILRKIDSQIHIALMNQYYPLYNAKKYPEINCIVTEKEFDEVYNKLLDLGFVNGWVQGEKSQEVFVPDFNKANPFE